MGLFEFKIRQFSKIMKWAEMQDVSQLRQFLFDDKSSNRLFVASGGSFSAAAYAELLATDQGFMSHALTPLLYMGSGFSRIATKVLLISASGYNNDIVRAYNNEYRTTKQKVGAVVLTPKGKLQSLLQEDDSASLFEYAIPTGRDGFLSTTTLVAFYALLYRAFGYTDLNSVNTDITESEHNDINNFVEQLKCISLNEMTAHEAFLHKLEGVDSFFILYSAKSYPVALDIESKFSEGAVGNTQLADYRNFAHGRFNWFTQRPGQTGLICLQTPDDMEMSEEILSMIPGHVPSLRISTTHNTPIASIDLLIKEHYLCSAIGQRWGLDLSRPIVPEYGRILHAK